MKKYCRACNQELPIDSFYYRKRDGYITPCKACSRKQEKTRNNTEHRKAQKKAAKQKYFKNGGREKQKEYDTRYRYGISLDDYNNLYDEQGGRCAICGDFYERLNIDHEHESGIVRGLLCPPCNRGIGLMKDRADILTKASEYLRNKNFFHKDLRVMENK